LDTAGSASFCPAEGPAGGLVLFAAHPASSVMKTNDKKHIRLNLFNKFKTPSMNQPKI
jgi:hypothetical protein